VVRRLATLIVAAALAHAGAAHADALLLDQAQQAIDDVDYATARKLATKALAEGALPRRELERAHRLLGESAAALGDDSAAREHFTRWLVLAPDAALAPGASPKIAGPFARARAAATQLGGFTADAAVARERDRVVVTIVGADPLAMVTGMRVRVGDGTEVTVADRRAELPTADAAAVTVTVALVDPAGDELVRREFVGAAVVIRPAPSRPPADAPASPRPSARHRWPTLVRWPTWAGVALIGAGVGGYFAWQVGQTEDELAALNAASDQHSFDEALALRDRGQRQALYANVGFGVAGAAAIAAVLTLVLEPGAAVEVNPAPGGATVGTSVRF
jgi:hypothetical protein